MDATGCFVRSYLMQANRYPYAGDDPVNQSDPSGLCSFPVGCAEDAGKAVANGVKKGVKAVNNVVEKYSKYKSEQERAPFKARTSGEVGACAAAGVGGPLVAAGTCGGELLTRLPD